MQVGVNPPGVIGYETMESHFMDVINKAAAGRMEVELFPPGALYTATEGLEAMGAGVAEMDQTCGGYVSGKLGAFAQFENFVPGLELDAIERYNTFYKAGFLELARTVFAEHNVFYLGPHLSSPWTLIGTVPIRTVEDFEGKKIREFGLNAQWYEKMGAKTVLVPAAEIYTALATGVVDLGRGGSPQWHESTGTYEVAPYLMRPWALPAPNNAFIASMDAWEALPDDLKELVEVAAQHASWAYVHTAYLEDGKSLTRMQEKGLEVIDISPEEWARMTAMVKDVWEEVGQQDEYGKQALAILKAYAEELGR
jgi:TRAP-type mannitol/chloroaromatic compound transport system substrate-binding protein